MKVLFVCHRFPYPPARGGKIRPFNIIRHLGGYADVTVASLVRSAEERSAGEGLAAHCRQVIAEPISQATANLRMVGRLPTAQPSSFGNFWSPALATRIGRELASGSYDLVFAHCSSAAPYVAAHGGCAKVLDFGDMDSEKWAMYASQRRFPLSAGYWLESVKLRRVERDLAARFDLCTATTAAEHDSLLGLGTARRTGWFPNGVDAVYFQPSGAAYDPDLVVFSGRMDYFPNQQAVERFCDDVLPLIREHRPAARLVVVGAEPPASIRRLGERPGITVTGTVPDVRPHVQRAAVSVAPLEVARGTQNKILESMAMGVPVVCTPLAARGVDAVAGEHLLTAGSPRQCADAVLRLLGDPGERAALARRARERVLSHHSWEHSLRRMDGLVERCLREVVAA
jgi:sugar transferase (PEP-CTERM/EpsH1 system associated)